MKLVYWLSLLCIVAPGTQNVPTSNVMYSQLNSSWQNLLDRLVWNPLLVENEERMTPCDLNTVVTSMWCVLTTVGRLCNPSTGNALHYSRYSEKSGLCGQFHLTMEPEMISSTGLVLSIEVMNPQLLGLNVSFAHFHLQTSEGRCSVDSLTVHVSDEVDTHCGHMLPWYRLSPVSSITLTYRAHPLASHILQRIKHPYDWGLLVRYSVVNYKHSVGEQEQWWSMPQSFPQFADYDFRGDISVSPAVLTYCDNETLRYPYKDPPLWYKNTWLINPSMGVLHTHTDTIVSRVILLASPQMVVVVTVCQSPCLQFTIFDGPHDSSKLLRSLDYNHTGCTKILSTSFIVLMKLAQALYCPNSSLTGSITFDYTTAVFQTLYVSGRQELTFPSAACYEGNVCRLKLVARQESTARFIQVKIDGLVSVGPNPKGCVYHGLRLLNTELTLGSLKYLEKVCNPNYRLFQKFVTPLFMTCDLSYTWEHEDPLPLPNYFGSHYHTMRLVLYHFPTQNSQFQVNLTLQTSPCPTYTVYCGDIQVRRLYGKDCSTFWRFNFPIENVDKEAMRQPPYRETFEGCGHSGQINTNIAKLCYGFGSPPRTVLLPHTSITCYNIQYFTNEVDTRTDDCFLEVHEHQDPLRVATSVKRIYSRRSDKCPVYKPTSAWHGHELVTFHKHCTLLYMDFTAHVSNVSRVDVNLSPQSTLDWNRIKHLMDSANVPSEINTYNVDITNTKETWAVAQLDKYDRKGLSVRDARVAGRLQELYHKPEVIDLQTCRETVGSWIRPHLINQTTLFSIMLVEGTCAQLTFRYALYHIMTFFGHYCHLNQYPTSELHDTITLRAGESHRFKSSQVYHLLVLLLQSFGNHDPCSLRITAHVTDISNKTQSKEHLGMRQIDSHVNNVLNLKKPIRYIVAYKETVISWKEAEDRCKSIGGHLPTAATDRDLEILKRLILGQSLSTKERKKVFVTPARMQRQTVVFVGKMLSKVSNLNNIYRALTLVIQINITGETMMYMIHM